MGKNACKLFTGHPYAVCAVICILVWVITGGSTFLIRGYGLSTKAQMIIYIAIMGITVVASVILAVMKKLNVRSGVLLIMAGGFLARLWHVIYATAGEGYQHDFGHFDYNFENAVHDNYMLYILKNASLPNFDFRGTGQFYHPPLHHTISAIAIKINQTIFPSRADNYEFLLCISLFYSLVILILIYRILKLFGFDGMSLIIPMCLASFYPAMIIGAGQINNDPLATLLSIAAFYHAVRWYRERGWKEIISVALCIGFAMMTKLSAGLMAFPVGFIFLAALFKAKGRGKKLWAQYGVFASLVFPLGLWFPVRNYIKWGIPPTYVFDLGIIPNQDLSGYSLLERLFGISEVSLSIPFCVYDVTYKDFNIFMILYKTSLFDDLDHHDKAFFILIATVIFILGMTLILIMATGFVKMIRKIIKERDIEYAAVVILFLTEIISIITFAMKYPLICSVSFRYIFVTVIFATLCLALFFKKTENELAALIQKIGMAFIAVFSLFSVIFYATEWMAMPFF